MISGELTRKSRKLVGSRGSCFGPQWMRGWDGGWGRWGIGLRGGRDGGAGAGAGAGVLEGGERCGLCCWLAYCKVGRNYYVTSMARLACCVYGNGKLE